MGTEMLMVILHVAQMFTAVSVKGLKDVLVRYAEGAIRWFRSRRKAISVSRFRFAMVVLGKDASVTSVGTYKLSVSNATA